MWSAGRYAILVTFLYASCSMGMQFFEPQTALDLAGPSDPFLPTTINPANDSILNCQIRGRNCHRTRCEEAGARCLPSWTGSSCLQHIQYGSAYARSMVWATSDQTRSACQDYVCQNMKTVKLEIKKTSRKKGRAKGAVCSMYSKRGTDCDQEGCKREGYGCVIDSRGYYCTFEFPPNGVAACDNCLCRKNKWSTNG